MSEIHSCNQKVIEKLEAEIERLSGKTGFCTQCEAYAREIDRLREALEKIVKHCEAIAPDNSQFLAAWKIAKAALEGKECTCKICHDPKHPQAGQNVQCSCCRRNS